MAERRRRNLHSTQANYLKSEIEGGSLIRKKQALQQICKLYRNGVTLQNDDRVSIEIAILGVLSSASSDEKVRRWALAALAYIGRRDVSRNAVVRALADYPNEPQVLAAAIATLFKFDGGGTQKLITDKGVCSPEMIALSALQTTDPDALELSNIRINIDQADPILLKLALLLVGLDRAPDNIFHPKYSNAHIVKVLGAHHEPIVSQYSIWAAAESPRLGVQDIGINIKTVDEQPTNVRAYVYRLFAEDRRNSKERHELIYQGSKDPEIEARVGLAIGLRDNYYDGLEGITVDWFYDEDSEDVSTHVLDHIVTHAENLESYNRIAIEQYEFAPVNSKKRARIEASAAGTKLYSELKRMSYEAEAGLFSTKREAGNVTNNTFINNGLVQGALSQSGEATNSGDMQAILTISQIQEAQKALEGVQAEIELVPLSESLRQEVREAIVDAKANTNKDTLGRVVSVLEKAERGLRSVEGMTEYAKKIGGFIISFSGFLS